MYASCDFLPRSCLLGSFVITFCDVLSIFILSKREKVDIKLDPNRKEWFCGKDVCEILGFRDSKDALLTKVRHAYKTGLKSLDMAHKTPANPVPHHAGKVVCISEAGLNQLIFSRRQSWVFKDVLPSIRAALKNEMTQPAGVEKNYIKKLREMLLKDNQKAQITLKEFIDYFQQDLNDPASILIAIEETMRIMKEEQNTEINISVGMI